MNRLSLDDARRVISAGQAEAARQGGAFAAVVLDGAMTLVAAERMDGARLLAAETAERKAFTALAMGAETKALCELVESDARQLAVFAADPKLKLLWGGVPLHRGDDVVGAVGVSGGTDPQDHAVASAAAAALRA